MMIRRKSEDISKELRLSVTATALKRMLKDTIYSRYFDNTIREFSKDQTNRGDLSGYEL